MWSNPGWPTPIHKSLLNGLMEWKWCNSHAVSFTVTRPQPHSTLCDSKLIHGNVCLKWEIFHRKALHMGTAKYCCKRLCCASATVDWLSVKWTHSFIFFPLFLLGVSALTFTMSWYSTVHENYKQEWSQEWDRWQRLIFTLNNFNLTARMRTLCTCRIWLAWGSDPDTL